MATVTTPMTTEEFLALPDDSTERWADRCFAARRACASSAIPT